MLLSATAIDIIKSTIGVNSLSEAMDRGYKDVNEQNDIDKSRVRLYTNRIRGSVRLGSMNFLTTKEYNQRAEQVLNAKLP